MQMLCTINYVLNGEKLALQDVTIHEAEQTSLKEQLERQRSDMAFAANDGLQPMHEHNAFTQEQQLLRQVKSIFVVTATLVSCAAIQGGLSPEDVFTLSDTYMQKCELPPALERITNLQYHMVLEFTEQVERLRFGGKPTVHEPPLPVHPVQKGERRDPDGLHPQRKNGGGQTPSPLFRQIPVRHWGLPGVLLAGALRAGVQEVRPHDPHRIPRPKCPVRPGGGARRVISCWLSFPSSQYCCTRRHRYCMHWSDGR